LLTVSKLEGYLPGDNVTTAQPVPLSVDPQRTALAATCVRMIVAKASQLWRGMKPTTTAESRAVYSSPSRTWQLQPCNSSAQGCRSSSCLPSQAAEMQQHFELLESTRVGALSSMSACSMVHQPLSHGASGCGVWEKGDTLLPAVRMPGSGFKAVREYLPGAVQLSGSSSSSVGREHGRSIT
jgi:hypothetical protein